MTPQWSSGVRQLLCVIVTFIAAVHAEIQCDKAVSPSLAPPNARAQIHRDIMCQYDLRIPPRTMTDVGFAMFIRTAKVVDSTLDMQTLAYVSWEDPSLVWDHDMYPIDEIEVRSDAIWTPEVTTIVTLSWQRGGAPQQMLWPTTCHVTWNGTVTCTSAMEVGGECIVTALHWPILDAACAVYVGLDFRTDSGVKMHFIESLSVERRGYVPDSDWAVTEVVKSHVHTVDFEGENSALSYAIRMRSRGAVQATALLGPGVVLGIVLTSSFCLPIGSSIRIGLSCCALLGTFIASSFLFGEVPPFEGHTPIAVTSYCGLLLLSGVATLFTIALAALLPEQHKAPVPPRWLYGVQDWLLNAKAGKAMLWLLLLSPKDKANQMAEAATTENARGDISEVEPDCGDDVAILTVTYSGYGPHQIWEFFVSFINRCLLFTYLASCSGICLHIAHMLVTYEQPDIFLY